MIIQYYKLYQNYENPNQYTINDWYQIVRFIYCNECEWIAPGTIED